MNEKERMVYVFFLSGFFALVFDSYFWASITLVLFLYWVLRMFKVN